MSEIKVGDHVRVTYDAVVSFTEGDDGEPIVVRSVVGDDYRRSVRPEWCTVIEPPYVPQVGDVVQMRYDPTKVKCVEHVVDDRLYYTSGGWDRITNVSFYARPEVTS